MSDAPSLSWPEANRRYLMAAVDTVRAALESHAARLAGRELEDRNATAAAALEAAGEQLPAPAALDRLVSVFGLTPFERGIVLMGVGMETDASFAALCAAAHNDAERNHPTFRVALDALPGAHWSALSPDGSLRRWRLVELGAGNALVSSPLRLAERVLHFLFGVDHLDERLTGLLEPIAAEGEPAPSHRALAERLAAVWASVSDAAAFPAVQLAGGEAADRRAIAAHGCARLGRRLFVLPAHLLPLRPEDLEPMRRLWEVEGALSGAALLIEGDGARSGGGPGTGRW